MLTLIVNHCKIQYSQQTQNKNTTAKIMSQTAYQPLHLKYRPQTLSQLVGQEHIKKTLINAINTGKIASAYLFSGARGTGKTSTGRILAKSLNCDTGITSDPCGVCESCKGIASGYSLDVIEIDAASNNGVDNVRDLISKLQFAPVGRYKVVILDEVHMMTTAAFNALLKTLEEPPKNVVFILATTDPQKVLPTIISRCQTYDFRRIGVPAMFQHLKEIAAKETIEIDDDAIFAICSAVAGGMRDAQAKLDQLSLYPVRITKALIYENLGRVSESMLKELALKIIGDNPSEIVGAVGEILNAGKEPIIVIQDLAKFYMNLLLYKTSGILDPAYSKDDFDVEICEDQIKENISKLKGSEWTIKTTNQSKLWLEVTLVGLSGNSSQPATQQKVVTSVLPLEQRIKIANRHRDLSDEIGWETIYIGRGTPFGNEYEVGVYGTADECVKAFKSSSWIKFKDEASDFRVAINDLLARLRAGSKIRLMCSCSNVCHGEVVRSLLIWAHKNV